jgi:hypothetical protein
MKLIGAVLVLCGGILLTCYYFAAFDASVATSDGGRVMNFSLMQQQRMGLTIGLSIAGAGFLWLLLESFRRPAVAPPVIAPSKPSRPMPWFAIALAVMLLGAIAAVAWVVIEDAARKPQPPAATNSQP